MPASVNTVLLHVFRELSAVGRSFSAGDLVFVDNGLTESMLEAGATPGYEHHWGEYTLRTPLEAQCPCEACGARAVPKSAADFRKDGEYVMLRLKQHSSASLVGVADMVWSSLGFHPHSVPGCHYRASSHRPYAFLEYDKETYALLCPEHTEEVFEELARYNRAARAGSEFYVPRRVVEAASKGQVV